MEKIYKLYPRIKEPAMKTETLRDASFNVIGYVQTDVRGDKTFQDKSFNTKGFYSKGSNATQDASFKNLAWGDQTRVLLPKN